MIKLIKVLYIPMALAMFFNSCTKEDHSKEGNLEIAYKLQYKGAPLSMFTHYEYPNGDSIFFSRFSFFMSDLRLEGIDSSFLVQEIKYYNLTSSHEDKVKALTGLVEKFEGIPAGTFNTLEFGMGVPSESNAKTPDQFPSSNDLSNQSEYWAGWKSYIFARTEGSIDLLRDGSYNTGVSLHLGADVAFRKIKLPKNIVIKEGETTKVTVFIDLYNEFMKENVMYDIAANPQTHSLSQQAQVIELANNLSTAFNIQ